MSYARNRLDFETLERLAELSDQQALDEARESLMQNPTKAHAAELYDSAIQLWFRQHGITPETAAIAKRHHIAP